MSRRSIFLLAAVVVLLYFSIILFMLSPFHGSRNAYYGGAYMFIRQVPPVKWCKELWYRSPPSKNVVALVSFPGSGNTWLRYLLQQVTGLVTGSIYMDNGLRMHGFPGESVTDGSVLVVKTHQYDHDKFNAAVLLIRNPKDAILADFNRIHKGHIGTAPKSAFMKKINKKAGEDWASHVSSQLTHWEALHALWLNNFPGPLHIVFYEDLVNDTDKTLLGILHFLNYNVTESDMKCAMRNKEGIYKRRKKLQDFDPFTADMYKSIEEAKSRVFRLVAEYRLRTTEKERSVTSPLYTYEILRAGDYSSSVTLSLNRLIL